MNWTFILAPLIPAAVGLSCSSASSASPLVLAALRAARAARSCARSPSLCSGAGAPQSGHPQGGSRAAVRHRGRWSSTESQSQEIGKRMRDQPMPRRGRSPRPSRTLPDTELRTAIVPSGISNDEDGTRALRCASTRRSPTSRPSASPARSWSPTARSTTFRQRLEDRGYDGPAARPAHRRARRDRPAHRRRAAPRFGIVGQEQTIELPGRGPGGGSRTARRRR